MNNNEIMQANLLDILFDGRNKEYGAYAIRRGYNHRMLMALGIGLSVILVMVFIGMNGGGSMKNDTDPHPDGAYILTPLETKPDPVPEQPKPKPAATKPASAEQVQTVRNTTPVVVDDHRIDRSEVPDVTTLADKISGLQTTVGKPFEGGVTKPLEGNSTSTQPAVVEDPPLPPAPSFPPEFPGGFKALQDFLSRNLNTPDNLEIGDKKIVKARFLVDKDGSVSSVEIEVSGGNIFDKEVIRVCKKMPKWKPAMQNGHTIAISYILPVTFIGVEQ